MPGRSAIAGSAPRRCIVHADRAYDSIRSGRPLPAEFRAYVAAVTGRPARVARSVRSMDPALPPARPPLSLFVVHAGRVAGEEAADRKEADGLSWCAPPAVAALR